MLVSPTAIFGTIGGGQLEFMAIDRAEGDAGEGRLLPLTLLSLQRRGEGIASVRRPPLPAGGVKARVKGSAMMADAILDIPLGPEIGQCCGGRVGLSIRKVDEAMRSTLLDEAKAEDAKRPHVYVFGGGHVGHALASAFALLPVQAMVVETRADALEGMPAATETKLTPVPEEMVRDAPAGSAYVVLTHDHALDFLIVAEALRREDAAYVGMIGSKTKKATFKSWYLKTAGRDGGSLYPARLADRRQMR